MTKGNNMISNQWCVVLESKELKKGKLLGVTRFGEKLVFWRDKENKEHLIDVFFINLSKN